MRGKFGCNRILDCFIEQDLKFESFRNLGLKYTLVVGWVAVLNENKANSA